MRTKCKTQNCGGRLTPHLTASRRVCEYVHRYVLCMGACGCDNAVYDSRSLGCPQSQQALEEKLLGQRLRNRMVERSEDGTMSAIKLPHVKFKIGCFFEETDRSQIDRT